MLPVLKQERGEEGVRVDAAPPPTQEAVIIDMVDDSSDADSGGSDPTEESVSEREDHQEVDVKNEEEDD